MKITKTLLASLTLIGLTLTSCTKEDLATPALKGSWSLVWVNDFVLDIKNAEAFKNLCEPGNEAELDFNGSAKARFVGNRSETNTMYFDMGDRMNNETPQTTLLDTSFELECPDVAVSSIEHRDIYITGQDGYISKKKNAYGKCVLYSERARTRPNYTVFIKLLAGSSETRTDSQGQTYTDNNNRMAGITVDCENRRITSSYRVQGAPSVSGPRTADGIAYVNSNDVQATLKSSSKFKVNSEIFKDTLVPAQK